MSRTASATELTDFTTEDAEDTEDRREWVPGIPIRTLFLSSDSVFSVSLW